MPNYDQDTCKPVFISKPAKVIIKQAFSRANGIYGLGSEQKIYKWDLESTAWELYNEALHDEL